jgi:hypothetical protein
MVFVGGNMKVRSRDELLGEITTPAGLRAGVVVDDNSWHWLKVEGYNCGTRHATSCEAVEPCDDATCARLQLLVESGDIKQMPCATSGGDFLIASL